MYERVELDTPEAAVESLIDAYEDRDFLQAWFILDTDAQNDLFRSVNNTNLRSLRRAPNLFGLDSLSEPHEHSVLNFEATIAQVLEHAADTGYLHVDLAGAKVDGTMVNLQETNETQIAEVTLQLDGGADAAVRLALSDVGKWRVQQIAVGDNALDNSGQWFVEATCGQQQVRVLPGASCPTDGAATDVLQELERLQAEMDAAGDDINKQLLIASQIAELNSARTASTDYGICAAIQGSSDPISGGDLADVERRAKVLAETTCPGELGLLFAHPEPDADRWDVNADSPYGRLDLSTPEQAVETFGELFANEAFHLLFFTFDVQAQRQVGRSTNNMGVDLQRGLDLVPQAALDAWPGLGTGEHMNSPVGMFAELVGTASATGNLYLDLSGPLDIRGVSATQWSAPDEPKVDAQLVQAFSESTGSEYYFLMVESTSGRWRVRYVSDNATSFDTYADYERVFVNS